MARFYSDPARESETYALPDCEVFYMSAADFLQAGDETWMFSLVVNAADAAAADYRHAIDSTIDQAVKDCANDLAGWYYWFCFPVCMPDSDPVGPFKTEREAMADARENG